MKKGVRSVVTRRLISEKYYPQPIPRAGVPPLVSAAENEDEEREAFWMGNCGVIAGERMLGVQCTGRFPTWSEIEQARCQLLPDDLDLAMLLPPRADYLNASETTLNLTPIFKPGREIKRADLLATPREYYGNQPTFFDLLPAPVKTGANTYSMGAVTLRIKQNNREGWSMALLHPDRWPSWDEVAQARYYLLPDQATMGFVPPRKPFQPGAACWMFELLGGLATGRYWKKDISK
jgi:hypothetical protein